MTVDGRSRRVQLLKPGASEGDRRPVSVGRLVYEAFVTPLNAGERVVRKNNSLGDCPENLRVLSPVAPATTYNAAHTRISSLWGSASRYPCVSVNCSGMAEEWAYDGTDPTHLFEEQTGGSHCHYSLWPEFYAPMCRPCHRARDMAIAAAELREYRAWKMRNPGRSLEDVA